MGKPLADMQGQVFGRLTVLERDSFSNGKTRWLCRCECGQSTVVIGQLLRNGKPRSCGCLRAERAAETATKHGGYVGRKPTRTMRIWKNMIQRTSNPTCPMYSRYGGAGINVCKTWQTFEGFVADMGEAPDGLTLERVDNSKGYSPENCAWREPAEQARNKRNNIWVTIEGRRMILKDWCEELGVSYGMARSRIKEMGWDPVEALRIPASPRIKVNWRG